MTKYNLRKYEEDKKAYTIRLSAELHRELKIYSAINNTTISDAIATSIITELIEVGQIKKEDVQ